MQSFADCVLFVCLACYIAVVVAVVLSHVVLVSIGFKASLIPPPEAEAHWFAFYRLGFFSNFLVMFIN